MVILRYRLEKFDRCLAFQVLWQTPSFKMDEESRRGSESDRNRLRFKPESSPLRVITESNPEIQDDAIYLQGMDKTDDHKLSLKYFSNNRARDTWFKNMNNSLHEWAARHQEWSRNPIVASDRDLELTKGSPRYIDLHI